MPRLAGNSDTRSAAIAVEAEILSETGKSLYTIPDNERCDDTSNATVRLAVY
ncbi:hypothetical protein LA5095_00619 [Roseibium album]|uniref:Uncharacterized protein n=1 Tax=Roseibium album TaxID=311410 RepID=A0A0M7AHK4_9HYPH|nr:hypothetical protein LA5094_03351 [Roseibium album]CTQ65656.1 hypothetical protein LA5095_00619 [Roseibium album]CTQ73700.1 hypothetical protein LA5096_03759 [Roseibium album]